VSALRHRRVATSSHCGIVASRLTTSHDTLVRYSHGSQLERVTHTVWRSAVHDTIVVRRDSCHPAAPRANANTMTTFTSLHLVPDGRAMLSCTCLFPDGWMQVPTPDEAYDFDNPGVFLPLLVGMAPYGAVVFTVAARPAFGDGTVQDWAEFLAAQNNLRLETVREARLNRLPCVLVEGTMDAEMGVMRSRSVFLEDGQRLYNIGALAPEAIWESVRADFDRLLGSFAPDEVHGVSAAPLRQMTSDPVVDLTALANAAAAAQPARQPAPQAADLASEEPSAEDASTPNTSATEDAPAKAADVAIADDAATLDPEHIINVRLRDVGAGLVPRVLEVVAHEKYAIVGAAAISSLFQMPFGWHVIDDGRRTLIFDVPGGVQISLNLRSAPDGVYALLTAIGDELASTNPQALFLKMELRGMPCLAIRDLDVDGEQLDQAYLAREAYRGGLALVCRVTATREDMTRAMNAAEVMLMSMQSPRADGDH
jgi:hypothetical protein